MITSRFSRVSFDIEKRNCKNREVFAPLSFVPNTEEFSLRSAACVYGESSTVETHQTVVIISKVSLQKSLSVETETVIKR